MKRILIVLSFLGLVTTAHADQNQLLMAQVRASTESLPIDGICVISESPRIVRIDWRPGVSVSNQQRKTAQALVSSTDISPTAVDAFNQSKLKEGAIAILDKPKPESSMEILLDALVQRIADDSKKTKTEVKDDLKSKIDSKSALKKVTP